MENKDRQPYVEPVLEKREQLVEIAEATVVTPIGGP